MASSGEHGLSHQGVDTVVQAWRQGDCVFEEQGFVHRFNPELPLREESADVADEGVEIVESSVEGLVVLTQTCDIVRKCTERPFLEVAPLIEVEEQFAREIERGRRPSYAIIPALRDRRLVADLDRTMTIEKAVLVHWTRVAGCSTDEEARQFSLVLARKRARFAFPDDFTEFAKRLQSRLVDKHDRQSDEGRALRALREIRVRAAPSWDHTEIELTLWFIRDEDMDDFEGKSWNALLEGWLRLIPVSGRFRQVDGLVNTLEDLTAKDYVESDPLDLDYLSTRDA